MVKARKSLIFVLIIMLSVISPLMVGADDSNSSDTSSNETTNTDTTTTDTDSTNSGTDDTNDGDSSDSDEDDGDSDNDEDEADEDDEDEDDEEDEIDKKKDKKKDKNKDKKTWEALKDALEMEKDAIEQLKDQVEKEIEALKKQLERAKENKDSVQVQELVSKIQELQQDKEAYFSQMKEKKQQMKAAMKGLYTQEELDNLEDISDQIVQAQEVKVLPVYNVIFLKSKVKFDTPPVIKEGRTLIPLRAISEAIGAEVKWLGAEKKIKVKKDNKYIVLILGSNEMQVNDSEVPLDVPAQLINNRTMVPLRFIMENFQLKVAWDGETETVEIE